MKGDCPPKTSCVLDSIVIFNLQEAAKLTEWGLRLIELFPGEVLELAAHLGPRAVSRNDLAAYLLARRVSCPLATDDRRLRELATKNKVSLRGTLWVLDRLVGDGFLPPMRAASALRRMLQLGTWLPKPECASRLRKWSSP